jgi:hypothetical protein
MVKLTFTRHHSPLNTTVTGPDGQTLYKVVTPFKFGSRTTTITALVDDVDDLETHAAKRDDDSGGKPDDDRGDDDGKSDLDDRDFDGEDHDGQLSYVDDGNFDYVDAGGKLDDDERKLRSDADDSYRFSQLAKIEWHVMTSNKIWFGGVEYDAKKYLRPAGLVNQLVSHFYFAFSNCDDLDRHRIFTGPDSKEYKWNLGRSGMYSPIVCTVPDFNLNF